jgi:KaiC/GvpD/RAD55 family RecA-like ATPase
LTVAAERRILGIPEIDEALAHALPAGWLALLAGTTAAGAGVLAKQFAQAGVGTAPVRFYTTYERTDDVRRTFSDFGWDSDGIEVVNLAEEYYERVLVRGLEVARARERGLTLAELESGDRHAHPPTAFRLTDRLLSDLAGFDGPFRLIVDSLDFFHEVLAPHDVTTVVRQIRHRCQTLGGQALLAVHVPRREGGLGGSLGDLADLTLDLRAEPKGAHYQHILSVEKVGHRPDLARVWAAEFRDGGWGVKEPAR